VTALDHVVVVHREPDRVAAKIADALGSTRRVEASSGDGYRAANVPIGDGVYVDVLWPESDAAGAAGAALRSRPDGALVAWAVEVDDAEGTAERLGVSYERSSGPDGAVLYELVGWPETVASGGLLPFGARYRAPMLGRRDRDERLWPGAPGGGVVRLVLRGRPSDRDRLDAMLRTLDAEAPEVDWHEGEPALLDAILGNGASLAALGQTAAGR
jgi:hypothetical protein